MATSGLNRNELSETACARSNVYHFLAEFYLRSPEEAGFDRLLSNDIVASLPEIFGETLSVRRLTYYIERLRSNTNHMKKVILDYHNLFTIPGSLYLTPNESCSRKKNAGSTSGRVWDEITIKGINSRVGADVTGKSLELFDQIGVELQFLGFLCRREAKAWKTRHERALKLTGWEAGFIQDHLGNLFQNEQACQNGLLPGDCRDYPGVCGKRFQFASEPAAGAGRESGFVKAVGLLAIALSLLLGGFVWYLSGEKKKYPGQGALLIIVGGVNNVYFWFSDTYYWCYHISDCTDCFWPWKTT